LLGTRRLRVGGWGGGGRLSKRRVARRPRGQSRRLLPSRW
jgi:hypothetical protein